MLSDKLEILHQTCKSFSDQIEKEIWSSERIRRINSTFHQNLLDEIKVLFPSKKQKFIYTLYIILNLGSEKGSWNRVLLEQLEKQALELDNFWLDVRLLSDIETVTKLNLSLIYDPSYNLKHFYSIIHQKEFKDNIENIGIFILKKDQSKPKRILRKRGYSDKGSLWPKHLTPIWTEKKLAHQIEKEIQIHRQTRHILKELYEGFIF